jgi:purine-binding chemotaxis protein CheW
MKNVIVFALGGERFALELRWVREIFALGPITPVPTAPAAIVGAVNFRGQIVPVLRAAPMLAAIEVRATGTARAPRVGDAAVLLDVDGMRAALVVDRIDEVTTLSTSLADHVTYEDSRGKTVRVLDAPGILAAARRLVGESVEGAGAPRG